MVEWYKKVVFENYANFNGRARRTEYWNFVLMNIIINILLSILDRILGFNYGGNSGVLSTIYSLFIILPSLAVATRRIHDIGKSGWWIFAFYFLFTIICGILLMQTLTGKVGTISIIISLFFLLVVFIWLIVLLATNGQEGTNEYGLDPKGNFDEEIAEIGKE